MNYKLPSFRKFLDVLNEAGVVTNSARGFWGGVTSEGEIVATTWIDAHDGEGRFRIWKPTTNHGNLRSQWEIGNIHPGTELKLVVIRQRGNLPLGEKRAIADAAPMPGKWRVVKMDLETDAGPERQRAWVEQVQG